MIDRKRETDKKEIPSADSSVAKRTRPIHLSLNGPFKPDVRQRSVLVLVDRCLQLAAAVSEVFELHLERVVFLPQTSDDVRCELDSVTRWKIVWGKVSTAQGLRSMSE